MERHSSSADEADPVLTDEDEDDMAASAAKSLYEDIMGDDLDDAEESGEPRDTGAAAVGSAASPLHPASPGGAALKRKRPAEVLTAPTAGTEHEPVLATSPSASSSTVNAALSVDATATAATMTTSGRAEKADVKRPRTASDTRHRAESPSERRNRSEQGPRDRSPRRYSDRERDRDRELRHQERDRNAARDRDNNRDRVVRDDARGGRRGSKERRVGQRVAESAAKGEGQSMRSSEPSGQTDSERKGGRDESGKHVQVISAAPPAQMEIETAPVVEQKAAVPAEHPIPPKGGPTRYFVIKSFDKEHVEISIAQGIWSTQRRNEDKLNEAFDNSSRVILVFSVNNSKHFQGYATMLSGIGRDKSTVWTSSSGKQSWGGVFRVKWDAVHDLPFSETLHLKNPLNENKPVKISRDCQELPEDLGRQLCALFDAGAAASSATGATKSEQADQRQQSSGEAPGSGDARVKRANVKVVKRSQRHSESAGAPGTTKKDRDIRRSSPLRGSAPTLSETKPISDARRRSGSRSRSPRSRRNTERRRSRSPKPASSPNSRPRSRSRSKSRSPQIKPQDNGRAHRSRSRSRSRSAGRGAKPPSRSRSGSRPRSRSPRERSGAPRGRDRTDVEKKRPPRPRDARYPDNAYEEYRRYYMTAGVYPPMLYNQYAAAYYDPRTIAMSPYAYAARHHASGYDVPDSRYDRRGPERGDRGGDRGKDRSGGDRVHDRRPDRR